MTENVVVPIIGTDTIIARFRGIPAAIEFVDLKLTSTNHETERALVGAVTRITLDANFAHRASAGWKDPP
jgi:hypothetical protein